MKKSLGIRNWEAAQKIVRDWEARVDGGTVSVKEAFERFIGDCEARELRGETLAKYRLLEREMAGLFGERPVDSVSVRDLAEYRETWKLAPISSRKKIERMRSFFKFCVERKYAAENPAKFLRPPRAEFMPTLPFTGEELVKIMRAVERYPDRPQGRRAQLRAFVLVLRHSGLRIRDAVCLERERVSDGAVFVYTAKTGTPVRCPLPQVAQDAIHNLCEVNDDRFFFYSGECNPKSAVADWQRTLKHLGKLGGVPDFHAHRFRDTFATDLLAHGVPLEDVSILLGHSDTKVTWRHYAPYVKVRQERLEQAVRRTFVD